MANKKYHIAQFGSFDVESMGDTLFPHGLKFGLEKYCDFDLELFSMNENVNPYNNNSHVYSLEQFTSKHELRPFDLVVLGGGEFLHFSPISFTVNGVEKPYPAGYLWREPIKMAQNLNIPVVINCVGAPHDFTPEQEVSLREQLDGVYVSVRDVFSARRLKAAGVENVHCVADNLWYMNGMYPKAELDALRAGLEEKTGRDFHTPYIIVQYGTTRDTKTLARQLQAIKDETGYRICLMPVNYCHEDRIGMQMLEAAGDGEFEAITDYFQPRDMIAVISGSRAFFGTSLHGNLTAASYGVPFVAIDMYPSFVSKMDGIFSMIGCESYLVPSEDAVKAAYDACRKDIAVNSQLADNIQNLQLKLDQHFQRVAQLLKGER